MFNFSPALERSLIIVRSPTKTSNVRTLSCVLDTGSNAFHGQDHGILQARRKLRGLVERHELRSPFCRDLGRLRHRLMAALLTHLLQRVHLLHIQRGDVRVSQPQPLLQCGIPLQNIRMPCNLPPNTSIHVTGHSCKNQSHRHMKHLQSSNLGHEVL